MENNETVKSTGQAKKILGIVVDVVAVIIFALVLYISIEVIVANNKNLKYVPIFGNAYVSVLSDSMKGTNEDSFEAGDLLVVDILDRSELTSLKIHDVVTYDGMVERNGEIKFELVTHRITQINYSDDGEVTSIMTRGDAELPTASDTEVISDNIVGKVVSISRGGGDFMMFLSGPTGFFLFVVIPALLVVGYCIVLFVINYKKIVKEKAVATQSEAQLRLEQEKAERERLEAELRGLKEKFGKIEADNNSSEEVKKD